RDIGWHFEPHVAEAVFDDLVREAGVRVIRGRLREKRGVVKSGSTLTALVTEDGATFAAKVFVDASYEGDLMAQAGVSYTCGREASAEYGASPGRGRARTPLHQVRGEVCPLGAGS